MNVSCFPNISCKAVDKHPVNEFLRLSFSSAVRGIDSTNILIIVKFNDQTEGNITRYLGNIQNAALTKYCNAL